MDYKLIATVAMQVAKQVTALTATSVDDVIVAAIEAALEKLYPLFGAGEKQASGKAYASLSPQVQQVVDSVVAVHSAGS